jgi:hypothetical protein
VNIWRIYRLPGSKQFWHVDSGEDSQVYNVLEFDALVTSRSVDIRDGFPRAWIEIDRDKSELHIVNNVAVFTPVFPINAALESIRENV